MQLQRFKKFAKVRQGLAQYYDKLLCKSNNIITLNQNYDKIVPHIYPVRIKGMNDRPKIISMMASKDIQVGYHYHPNHKLGFYRIQNAQPLPITEKVFPELLTLPLHPDLTFGLLPF